MESNDLFKNTAEDDPKLEDPVTKKDILKLQKHIVHIHKVLKEHEQTQKLLKRALAKKSRKVPNRQAVLPKTPFNTSEAFKQFENEVEMSEDKFEDLVAELAASTCGTSRLFIKEAWRQILTDKAARDFSWQGTEDKLAIKTLNVTAAIKQAYTQKYTLVPSEEFQRTCIAFFQQANNRLTKKLNYVKKQSQ